MDKTTKLFLQCACMYSRYKEGEVGNNSLNIAKSSHLSHYANHKPHLACPHNLSVHVGKWSQALCSLNLAVNELPVRFLAIIEHCVPTMKVGIS